MNNKAKSSAFTLGLAGGVFNVSFGIIAVVAMIKEPSSHPQGFHPIPLVPQIVLFILSVGLILMCFLNFIGSCVCSTRRIAGGVMMLISAILLLFRIIISLSNVLYSYSDELTSDEIMIYTLYFIAQILSIIGAIICFTGPASPDKIPNDQPYVQPQQPHEGK